MGKTKGRKEDVSHGFSDGPGGKKGGKKKNQEDSGLNMLMATAGSSGRISKAGSSKKPPTAAMRNSMHEMQPQELLNMGHLVSSEQIRNHGRSYDGFLHPNASSPSSSSLDVKSKGQMKKKDKARAKKDAFQDRILKIQADEKEKKDAVRRRQTPVVGDTKPMLDALTGIPTMSSVPAAQGSSTAGGAFDPLGALAGFVTTHNLQEYQSLPKKKFNAKQRQKEIQEGLAYFAATMNCPPPQL